MDSIWVSYDSVRTSAPGQGHWYYLRGTGILRTGIWICRDSAGDLWTTQRNFQGSIPFLFPSKVHGEKWGFRNFCPDPDTLFVADTAALFFALNIGLIQDARKISAKASCPLGDWDVLLARSIGPVRWRMKSGKFDLVGWRSLDDAWEPQRSDPVRILNSD